MGHGSLVGLNEGTLGVCDARELCYHLERVCSVVWCGVVRRRDGTHSLFCPILYRMHAASAYRSCHGPSNSSIFPSISGNSLPFPVSSLFICMCINKTMARLLSLLQSRNLSGRLIFFSGQRGTVGVGPENDKRQTRWKHFRFFNWGKNFTQERMD